MGGSFALRRTSTFSPTANPSPIDNTKLRGEIARSFTRRRCTVEWRAGSHDDPVPLLLRVELPRSYGGLGSDILWAHKPWQREALTRAVQIRLLRRELPVLHFEDLILLKLEAGGDFADVSSLLNDPPALLKLSRLKESAARLRLAKPLERCLREITRKS